MDTNGLSFRDYPRELSPVAIEERQGLYQELCERIWDPAAMGIPTDRIVNDQWQPVGDPPASPANNLTRTDS